MGKDLSGKEIGDGISQRKDGRYCARYVDRFNVRKSIYDRNLRLLKDKLNTAMYENKKALNIVDEKTTLDEWFEKWLTIHKYKVIRESTKCIYTQVYTKHISPILGNFRISKITQIQIKGLLNDLDKRGFKFETKNKVRILLIDMFDKAMIDDFMTKNPAKRIKLIRDESLERRVLTVTEQEDFFECARGTFYNNLYVVAISTGLRPGELYALTWDDIDMERMEININKTLLYQKLEGDQQKTFHLHPPKTRASNRRVPINKQCEIALKKQRLQNLSISSKMSTKKHKGLEDLLFTTKYGTPINAQIYSDSIKRIIDEINLMRTTLEEFEAFSGHCFRHTFATRCMEANIAPKTVQQYLGHASLKMTMDLYTHVLDDYKQSEMLKLESMLEYTFGENEERIQEKYQKIS